MSAITDYVAAHLISKKERKQRKKKGIEKFPGIIDDRSKRNQASALTSILRRRR